MSETETIGVEVELLGIERATGCGALLAVANVAVRIYDIELVFQGCQIRTKNGRYVGQSPRWRHPHSGVWLPCVVGPEALTSAIGDALTAAAMEMQL